MLPCCQLIDQRKIFDCVHNHIMLLSVLSYVLRVQVIGNTRRTCTCCCGPAAPPMHGREDHWAHLHVQEEARHHVAHLALAVAACSCFRNHAAMIGASCHARVSLPPHQRVARREHAEDTGPASPRAIEPTAGALSESGRRRRRRSSPVAADQSTRVIHDAAHGPSFLGSIEPNRSRRRHDLQSTPKQWQRQLLLGALLQL